MLKLIGWVENHPWITLFGVLAVTAAFIASIFIFGITQESDFTQFMPQDHPAVVAYNSAKNTYGAQDLFLVALVAEDTIFKTPTLAKFLEMEEAFEALPGVEKVRGPATADVIYGTETAIVVEPAMPTVPQTADDIAAYRERVLNDRNLRGLVVSEDGTAGAISIKLENWADAPTVVGEIEAVARRYEGPETLYLAGDTVLRSEVAKTMASDLQRLIPFVILVMVAVLLVSFRNLRGVLLPLSVVITSTVWTIGTMAIFGQPMTPFSVIMPVMLIAIGVADGIHILNKYNEAVALHPGSRKAVVLETMREMISPVVLTSVTTAAGFLALLGSFLWPQRSLGWLTALGVLYAMALSLTLLPALLARLPLPKRKPTPQQVTGSRLSEVLAGMSRLVAKKPTLTLALAAVILVVFVVGIPQVRIETQPDKFLGDQHPVIQAMHLMDERFGGSMQMAIDIRTGRPEGLKDPDVLKQIVALQNYLLTLPEVGQVSSIAKVAMQMHETIFASDPTYYTIPDDPRRAAQLFVLFSGDLDNMALGDFSRGEVTARVREMGSEAMIALRQQVEDYLAANFNGDVKAEMVGTVRQFSSIVPLISQSQINSLLISLVVVAILVALLMRSLLGGIISVVPLVFTLAIAFGSMAYLGIAVDMATLMLGSVAIGIGIDYAIHFMSRYRQEFAANGRRKAYENTMRTTGKGIFFNAVALTLSFGVLLASDFRGNINFGGMVMLTMVVSSLSAMSVIPTVFMLRKPAFLKPDTKTVEHSDVTTLSKEPSTE